MRPDQPRSAGQPPAPVRTAGGVPWPLLLPVLSGDGGEPGADAAAGRVASGASGLWQPQAEGAVAAGRPLDQSQAGGAPAEGHGDRGHLRQAEVEPKPELGHQIYPYLLRDLEVTGPDQVWCSDITYVPMATGFLYLVAVMDWWSRYVLGWRLSNTMEAAFCVEAWEAALRAGRQAPLISNTDQGSQFTSPMFIDAVESAGVDVSMDGRGRWLDNRFIERLWRSVKYEDIYVQDYGGGLDAGRGLGRWFDRYNQERPHQGLGYATPAAVYFDPGAYGAQPARWESMQPQIAPKTRPV
jgi:transposase InsO family protein